MFKFKIYILCYFALIATSNKIKDEEAARNYLQYFESIVIPAQNAALLAKWGFVTNMTEHNQKESVQALLILYDVLNEGAQNVSNYDWQNFQDPELKRQIMHMAYVSQAVLNEEDGRKLETLKGDMTSVYSTARMCKNNSANQNQCYSLQDLEKLMVETRDLDELKWAWESWRDSTGKVYKTKYEEYVKLINKAAHIGGFENTAQQWQLRYEEEDFEAIINRLLSEIKPLYQHLHAFVYRRLKQEYGKDNLPKTGHIPAHMLGNMWAQSWDNIMDLMLPYPDEPSIDITQALLDQGYDTRRMFETANEFFTSIGLESVNEAFWENSMLEKPSDGRDVVCHASAWNFYTGNDYRIKMCTTITAEDFYTIHHELGHIQYYIQYKDQPYNFNGGANPGFHEAVGDVLALSVVTPEHLHKIGLLDEITNSTAFDLNFLMTKALDKIVLLPFAYVLEQWRWGVFEGKISPQDYTRAWWNLRCKHQGVSPPVPRGEEDFDPGAKYHVPTNVPYIRYFVAHVLQFQFHRALCQVSGHTGPLHRCDIYRSQEAGTKLKEMLQLGSSKPWPESLESITGEREISADALLEYYQPIYDWLKDQNEGYDVTWEDNCPEGSIITSGVLRHGIANWAMTLLLLILYLQI